MHILATIIRSYRHFLPDYATRERFNFPLFSVYVLLHVAALAAPFTFSGPGLIAFVIMYFMTICLGITLCYHRLLAHRSYKTLPWVTYILTFLGCLAFQRGPIWWVASHRLHHSVVDREGDPHSPRFSFLWSHFLWAFYRHPQLDESPETTYRLARDIHADPVMRLFEKHYTSVNILALVLLFGIGYLLGGWPIAFSVLVWGGFLRLVFCLNITWLVNSVAHLWGYRNYETPDQSRNNPLVALLTYGEGWHNNHHADQRAARNGHQWFELDPTYWLIQLMKTLGLAHHIVPVRLP
jgi:fatty-acid desaturase